MRPERRIYLALGAEAVLVLAGLGLLLGRSRGVIGPALLAVALGFLVMLVLGVPSLLVLLWGRDRSHRAFLASVAIGMVGKFAVVGAIVVYVVLGTSAPRLEFLLGLLGGWVVSFVAQALILRATLKGPREG